MNICPNCGHKNMLGAMFCDNCHVALDAIPVGTYQLDSDNELVAGGDKLDEEHIIFLHLQGFSDPVTVKIEEKISIGRTGGAAGNDAHLNLDGYGAETMGVSRRHAELSRDGDNLYLNDLNSTNGTFLNGQKLTTGSPKRVHDGDEIRLGHMSLRLFFK